MTRITLTVFVALVLSVVPVRGAGAQEQLCSVTGLSAHSGATLCTSPPIRVTATVQPSVTFTVTTAPGFAPTAAATNSGEPCGDADGTLTRCATDAGTGSASWSVEFVVRLGGLPDGHRARVVGFHTVTTAVATGPTSYGGDTAGLQGVDFAMDVATGIGNGLTTFNRTLDVSLVEGRPPVTLVYALVID